MSKTTTKLNGNEYKIDTGKLLFINLKFIIEKLTF